MVDSEDLVQRFRRNAGVGDLCPFVHARSTRDQKPVLRGCVAFKCAR